MDATLVIFVPFLVLVTLMVIGFAAQHFSDNTESNG
jgi:hypothetical protein